MNVAVELLSTLRQCGATVAVFHGRLRVEAPKGALTPGLREALAAHKAEVIALLATPDHMLAETFERIAGFWIEGAALPGPDLEHAIEQAAVIGDPTALQAALDAYEGAALANCQALAPCPHVTDLHLIRWYRENPHSACARCWAENGR